MMHDEEFLNEAIKKYDEARQAEAKRLGEDDPYGIYGESS